MHKNAVSIPFVLLGVSGRGSRQRRHKELVASSFPKRCLGVSAKLATVIDFSLASESGNGLAKGGSILDIISDI